MASSKPCQDITRRVHSGMPKDTQAYEGQMCPYVSLFWKPPHVPCCPLLLPLRCTSEDWTGNLIMGNRLQRGHNDCDGTWCPQHKVPVHESMHLETRKATQVWPALWKTVFWHIAAMHMEIHLDLARDACSPAVQWSVLFISWERSKKQRENNRGDDCWVLVPP